MIKTAAFLIASVLSLSLQTMQAQSIFGKNLIVNGDAESGPSDPDGHSPVSSIPNWKASGAPDVVQYASGYNLSTTSVGPLNEGKAYFTGGRAKAASSLSQTIDISSGASTIDAGTVTLAFSGYLGGYQDEPESAQMAVTFLDSGGRTLSSLTLGPVTSSDRVNTTGLWFRRAIGQVPAGARSATVLLQFNYVSSSTSDGVADNLSFVLNAPAAASSLMGSNIVVNGNAEISPVADPATIDGDIVDVPGWSRTGAFTIDSYTDGGADLDNTSPGPPDRGSFYFTGGPSNALSSAFQDIDVSSAASLIDAGSTKYALSAWIGGYSSQEDNAVVTVQFRTWSGTVLGSVTLGPVTAGDRNNDSAALQRSQNGGVPSGTRAIRVMMVMTRTDGSYNDGIVDSLSLVLSSPAGGPPPSIFNTGVVSAQAFGGFTSISPGSWIEIYGSNLAPDTRGWGGADFVGSSAPTSLDGVKVGIGGQSAFVDYISAGQVNAQIPSNIGTGPQLLTITTPSGTSSPYSITVNTVQPGLLAPASFSVGGKQYVVAILPDGTYVAPQSAIPGVTSRSAHPGETVVMYGVGFGAVSPAIAAGQIVGQANTLALPLTLLFGSTQASLAYDGLAPNYVGLYQFNVVIPNVSDNAALPVTFTLGGNKGSQTLYTAVQH